MTAPLPQDLRRLLVQAVEEGSSRRAAAERFGVSHNAVGTLLRRVRETGSLLPAYRGSHRKSRFTPHEALLRELVGSRTRITLAEVRHELEARGIQPGSVSTTWRTLKRLGLLPDKGVRNG